MDEERYEMVAGNFVVDERIGLVDFLSEKTEDYFLGILVFHHMYFGLSSVIVDPYHKFPVA